MNLVFSNKTIDGIEISGGSILVKQKIDGNMELEISAAKCSLDMKDCFKFTATPPFSNLCGNFEHRGTFYSKIFESISPPWKCPIAPGNYTMQKTTVDLSIVSMFPLDGSVWITTFKFTDEKSKKIYMCLNSETKILRKRVRN